MFVRNKLVLLLMLGVYAAMAYAVPTERITNFDSDITIHTDGWLMVPEK